MTHNPFDSSELGRVDEQLDRVAERLESYAATAGGEPPSDLSERIRAAVEIEASRRRPVAAFLAAFRRPGRSVAALGAVALAVAAAIVVGQLAELARDRAGDSPSPSVTVSPSPTPTPSPSATSSASPSPSPSPTPTDSAGSSSPEPSPSATGEAETETPHPSGSDNSGPGGGGGSSGPGGGGSSGSGSGSGGDDTP